MNFSRHSLLPLALLSFALIAGCARAPDRPAANIVLITLDTTRADHLGCYGYFRDTSPTIDSLAAEWIFFERCIVPMAATLPTHCSILTGTYPAEHGVFSNHNVDGERFVPTENLRSVAEACRDLGYETAAFISAAPLKRQTGVDAGFDHFDEPEGPQRPAGETVEGAISWLAERGGAPFLLWLHLYDPHFPFEAPPPYDSLFTGGEDLEAYLRERAVPDQVLRPWRRQWQPEESRWATNAYDGEVRYMDSELARFLAALAATPGWERTALLVIGDHGEGLCQHGVAGHTETWGEQLHVPLLMRIPGEPHRVVAGPLSAVDAIATLLAALGGSVPEGLSAQMSGRDVLRFASPGDRPIFSQDGGGKIRGPNYRYTATDGRWKYFWVQNPDGQMPDQLYDLEGDPYELVNVIDSHPEEARRLRDALAAEIARQEEWASRLRPAAGRVEGAGADSALVRELEALGYVE